MSTADCIIVVLTIMSAYYVRCLIAELRGDDYE